MSYDVLSCNDRRDLGASAVGAGHQSAGVSEPECSVSSFSQAEYKLALGSGQRNPAANPRVVLRSQLRTLRPCVTARQPREHGIENRGHPCRMSCFLLELQCAT